MNNAYGADTTVEHQLEMIRDQIEILSQYGSAREPLHIRFIQDHALTVYQLSCDLARRQQTRIESQAAIVSITPF